MFSVCVESMAGEFRLRSLEGRKPESDVSSS